MKRKLIAIVPAAGVGERSGAGVPKQYRLIGSRPMLCHSVRALLAEARISQVRVAVAPDDRLAQAALEGLPRTVWRACGGPSRADTVRAALAEALDSGALHDADWVLVHDAARPGLPADALARLVSACLQAGQGGLLALPVADTLKQAQAGAQGQAPLPAVRRTLARDGLWLAQTPQMFPAGKLLQALTQADRDGAPVTDEASAMEHVGCRALLVRGSMRNFKVTWPEDFSLMALWLDQPHD